MSDGDGKVRGLGPMLWLAIALDAVGGLLPLAVRFLGDSTSGYEKLYMASHGINFASDLLYAAGCFDLARRLAGRERQGVRVAAYTAVAWVGLSLLAQWLFAFYRGQPSFETPLLVHRYAAWALALAFPVALAVAAWTRRGAALAAIGLALVGHLPPFVQVKLMDALGSNALREVVWAVSTLAYAAACAVALVVVARRASFGDFERAARGLRRVGGSLKLRVVAALVASGLTLLLMAGSNGGAGALDVLRLALISGAAINLIAQLVMVAGVVDAVSASLAELPAWLLAGAAALAGWGAGVMAAQLPVLYQMLYGSEHGAFMSDRAQMFAVALPVVVLAGIAAVAAAISTLAARRNDEQLRVHASGKGVGFVGLAFAGIAITAWVVPDAKSTSGLAMMMLCAAIAMIWAHVLMAQLCTLAAESLEAQPGLPAAKLVG